MEAADEVNFDSIAGPTYNYSSVGPGNLASMDSLRQTSNPKQVALEGLRKAEVLVDLGVPQALLPPLSRPDLWALYRVGLIKDKGLLTADDLGSLAKHLSQASVIAPQLLAACFAGTSLWANNAAVVSPSADTDDNRVHFTPANMISAFHRSLEANEISQILRQIFQDDKHFVIHDPLPCSDSFGDEGAANHLRLGTQHSAAALNVFIYGRTGFGDLEHGHRYRPRQTQAASEAIARLHRLNLDRTLFVKQSSDAVDAGIFHNDVICASNLDLLIYHENAFADTPRDICKISAAFSDLTNQSLRNLEVLSSEVSLKEAAATYLFNSQIVKDGNGKTVLIAPRQCQLLPATLKFLTAIKKRSSSLIDKVLFVDVGGSMRGGGGPACLRLRVVLTNAQKLAIRQSVLLTKTLLRECRKLVQKDYPTEVHERMFADEDFLRMCFRVTEQIYGVLGLALPSRTNPKSQLPN
jgi:succinylarginine dihydrolase